MIPQAKNSDTLLALVSKNGLFDSLVRQINKDFELSGLAISLKNITSSDLLLQVVYEQLHKLLQTNFEGYLQLLYRVDISESLMQSDRIQNSEEMAKNATFLILKREWEKVYYRNHFS